MTGLGSWEVGIILGILAPLSILGGLVLKSEAKAEPPESEHGVNDILQRLERIETATDEIRKRIEADQRLAELIEQIGKRKEG